MDASEKDGTGEGGGGEEEQMEEGEEMEDEDEEEMEDEEELSEITFGQWAETRMNRVVAVLSGIH